MPGEKEQYYNERQEDSNQDFLGIILDYDEENKLATIEERNYFKIGDKVTIFGNKIKDYTFTLSPFLK
jgi:putative protease